MGESSLILPLRSGANYAPLLPLLSLQKENPKSHYLTDAIKERWNHFYNNSTTKSTWQEMVKVGKFTGRILQGDQQLVPNPWTNGWLAIKLPREDDSTERALNLMQFYISNCISKDLLSNPDVVVKPGRDTDQSKGSAKAAGVIVDHYEEKFFDPWFVIQECLLKYCFGTWITRLRHDPGIKGITAMREITENRTITMGEGSGWCGDCGASGAAEDFTAQEGEGCAPTEQCPACGSGAVMVTPAATAEMPVVTGQQEVELGDLVLDELPFPYCRWDLLVRPEDSSWFGYERRVPLGAIRRLLGPVRFAGGSGGNDFAIDAVKALAYSGLSLEGKGQRNHQKFLNSDEVNLCELWLSPDDYADITVKGDEQSIASEEGQADPLPVGASLADVFPDGLVAVGVNGMHTLLGLYAEKHVDCLASGVWHAKPMSGAGRGVQDVVEVQKRLNRLDSQALDFMDSVATPATLGLKGAIDDDQAGYLGKPRANIMIELSKLPEGAKLSDVVSQLPAQSVPGQMIQYIQQFLTQAFSTTSHQTDFSNGGLMDQRNDTAHGAAIADANAKSVVAPMMAIKALHRKNVAKQVVRMYGHCFPLERYFPLAGKHGEQQGVYLAGTVLQGADRDLLFEVVPESELPENSASKINRTVNFFSLFGGFPQYMQAKQQDPVAVANLERLWNIQMDDDGGFDVTAQLGRRMLDQMQSAVKTAQSSPIMAAGAMAPMPIDPMGILAAIKPPPSIIWPDLPGLVRWLQHWSISDEALKSPMELLMAVELLAQQLFQMGGLQQGAMAAQAAQVQGAGQPPVDQQGPPPQQEAA